MSGVFITRGMTVAIPAGGLSLSIGDDGVPKGSNLTLHVHYDVCPTWLDLADRHLADAEKRKLARVAAWQADDQDARAATLEGEFESSMQAIMAAAIAVDSFYAALRDKTTIPKETMQIWRKKRTARYRQVAEVLRCAFSLSPKGIEVLRNSLKQVFRFRDLAVHPSGDTAAPVLHHELQVGVEWRFDVFRADNARPLVQAVRNIIHELVTKGKPSSPEIARYVEGLRNLLAPQLPAGEK
jgi:hypothetical protein